MSDNETVRIEKLVHGGYGLGRLGSGLVALVNGVLPDELVEVEPIKLKRDMGFFRAVRVLRPSPKRVKPVCRHFSECGGCQLQHIPYENQLQAKRAMFMDALARQKGLEQNVLHVISDVFPALNPLGYRHFMRFHCAHPVDARPFLGLAKRWSNEILATPDCHIADSIILECMNSIQSSKLWPELAQYIQEISLGISIVERMVVAVIFLKKDVAGVSEQLMYKIFAHCERIKACAIQDSSAKSLKTSLLRQGCDVFRRFPLQNSGGSPASASILASPSVFVQNNWPINLAIQELIRENIARLGSSSILDLHCGMGNFLLACADSNMRLYGSDVACEAIANAQRNAKNLGLFAEFTCKTAQKQAEILIKHKQRFDLILLDPARGGCREIIPLLPKLSHRIVYVSCDPPALARDLVLLEQTGYLVQKIHLFDMFPQTHHLESVTILERA
ncbi:MAG: 23S rRNA (uracil(1939)-C(5))-methyltransferase RlmD [Dissulfuribacterales bacterium]